MSTRETVVLGDSGFSIYLRPELCANNTDNWYIKLPSLCITKGIKPIKLWTYLREALPLWNCCLNPKTVNRTWYERCYGKFVSVKYISSNTLSHLQRVSVFNDNEPAFNWHEEPWVMRLNGIHSVVSSHISNVLIPTQSPSFKDLRSKETILIQRPFYFVYWMLL